jgi:hypothetical protein
MSHVNMPGTQFDKPTMQDFEGIFGKRNDALLLQARECIAVRALISLHGSDLGKVRPVQVKREAPEVLVSAVHVKREAPEVPVSAVHVKREAPEVPVSAVQVKQEAPEVPVAVEVKKEAPSNGSACNHASRNLDDMEMAAHEAVKLANEKLEAI